MIETQKRRYRIWNKTFNTDTMMKKYNSKYKNSLVKCCNGHF